MKIPQGGGGVCRRGRGVGRVSAANWGFCWGEQFFFFRGRNGMSSSDLGKRNRTPPWSREELFSGKGVFWRRGPLQSPCTGKKKPGPSFPCFFCGKWQGKPPKKQGFFIPTEPLKSLKKEGKNAQKQKKREKRSKKQKKGKNAKKNKEFLAGGTKTKEFPYTGKERKDREEKRAQTETLWSSEASM